MPQWGGTVQRHHTTVVRYSPEASHHSLRTTRPPTLPACAGARPVFTSTGPPSTTNQPPTNDLSLPLHHQPTNNKPTTNQATTNQPTNHQPTNDLSLPLPQPTNACACAGPVFTPHQRTNSNTNPTSQPTNQATKQKTKIYLSLQLHPQTHSKPPTNQPPTDLTLQLHHQQTNHQPTASLPPLHHKPSNHQPTTSHLLTSTDCTNRCVCSAGPPHFHCSTNQPPPHFH